MSEGQTLLTEPAFGRLRPLYRWVFYIIVAIILALLTLFPKPEIGRAKILPQDASSTGINSVLSSLAQQDGVFAAFLSNRQAIDLYLQIARSHEVRQEVATSLKLVGPNRRYADMTEALIDLEEKVEINSLTGGLIQIEVLTHDANEALSLTKALTRSISMRIGKLGREQLEIKEKIVSERFKAASTRVAAAEGALDVFRKRSKLSASPEAELGVAITQRATIESQLKARQVELQTVRKFAGPENYEYSALLQEVAALQRQLAGLARSSQAGGNPNTVALTEKSSEYLALFRDYTYAQGIFEVYSRFNEQVAVESLSAATVENVQIVENPLVDPIRHYNVSAFALLLALGVLVFILEFYGPATGLIRRQSADGDI